MKPVSTESTNCILKGNDANVIDLPVTRVSFGDGSVGVESCWELTPEEIQQVIKTGKVYFLCVAPTHPPIWLSTESSVTTMEVKGN